MKNKLKSLIPALNFLLLTESIKETIGRYSGRLSQYVKLK